MLNIKEDILKNAGNQRADGPYCIFSLLWKSMGTNNCLALQNIFNIRKKLIEVWNDTRVSTF